MIAIRKVVPSLTAAMPEWLLVICDVCLGDPRGERVAGRQVAPALR